MSSIPDSISPAQLASMHETAPEGADGDLTALRFSKKDYFRIANGVSDNLEDYGDPVIDKLVIMNRLARLMSFHSEMSVDVPADEPIGKLCWARDAGKLQAMMCIMSGICMGDNDFLYEESNPDDTKDKSDD